MTIATSIQVDPSSILIALDNLGVNLKREIGIINRRVARKTRSLIAKEVTKELAVTQKSVRATITVHSQSRLSLSDDNQAAEVELKKTDRLSLKRFKPRQLKRGGVSYKISKTQGRKTIPGAFIAGGLNGQVFVREGKERLPIRKLYGPSPWGVHVVNKQVVAILPKINGELRKQMNERLRYQTLKQSGAI